MRAALLLFSVINHQSGKQILQIHPYIHFLYTRIFLFPYPLFIVHSYALHIFYHVLLHIPGLCLSKFPALVNYATILFLGLTAYACRSAFIFCSPTIALQSGTPPWGHRIFGLLAAAMRCPVPPYRTTPRSPLPLFAG